MVYAVVCPLSHGFCALSKLGECKVLCPTTLLKCVYPIVNQPILVIWQGICDLTFQDCSVCCELSSSK